MQLPQNRRRPLAIALIGVGGALTVVNALGQEVFGWGFAPGGVVSALVMGTGVGLWRTTPHAAPAPETVEPVPDAATECPNCGSAIPSIAWIPAG